MRILVACEFSGIVRDAFRAQGHVAWSCDLLPCESDPTWHLQCDVRRIPDQHWDLVIAHPPCTYLCNSGVRWFSRPSRVSDCNKACDFFLSLWNFKSDRVCIENPIPHKYALGQIPAYTQLIQPWQFGHGETKATCLWLKNLPPLQPTHREGDLFCQEAPAERRARVHLEPPGPDRWKNRSRTYEGVARAMAEQWGQA